SQADHFPGTPDVPQSLNRYGYAFGSPMMMTDPTGFAPVPVMEGLAVEAGVKKIFKAEMTNRGLRHWTDPTNIARILLELKGKDLFKGKNLEDMIKQLGGVKAAFQKLLEKLKNTKLNEEEIIKWTAFAVLKPDLVSGQGPIWDVKPWRRMYQGVIKVSIYFSVMNYSGIKPPNGRGRKWRVGQPSNFKGVPPVPPPYITSYGRKPLYAS